MEKAERVKLAAHARTGLTIKMQKQKAAFLSLYDPALTVNANAEQVGISPQTYFDWLRNDEAFAKKIAARKAVLADKRVTAIVGASLLAATGQIETEKKIYDGKGNLKERHTVAQPPSFKHAELLLRAYDPDTFKPDGSGGVAVTINMSTVSGTDGAIEIDAIDITDDPGASLDLF
jgi:hypothetical protein